jgi:tetratricopeptide (TPR) repeat protein
MDALSDSATNVDELPASGQREPKVMAAARVLSIDYQPIIEEAVGSLTENTPDTREEVYAHARGVVKRHLQRMSLPEPVVELEMLVLDLAIGKIERHWQGCEAAEEDDREDRPERQIGRNTVPFGLLANVLTAVRAAASFLPLIPGRRPTIPAMLMVAKLLRPLAIPIGAAMVLSTVAATMLFGIYADNSNAYRKLVSSPVGRWLAGVKAKSTTAPRVSALAGHVRSDHGPTQVDPIYAPFAPVPDAPAAVTISAVCDGEASISERNTCTHEAMGGSTEADAPKSDSEPPWLAGFATLRDSISGQTEATTPTSPTMPAPDVIAGNLPPQDKPEPTSATPGKPPTAVPGAAAQDAPTPLIKPLNPKVIALVESGKRAALKGDLDRAVRDFSEAIRIDPSYPDSYAERGQTLFKLGEVERAIADYSAALARDPQHGTALRARGMAYLYGGKTDVALADLSRTIELGERDPKRLAPIELFYARRSRGSIYDSKQQYDLEIADCTALIESYMRDPMLVAALTENYGSAGAANILATIYRQRAKAFVKKSDWERAVADLTQAIPLSSDHGYTALIDRSRLHEGLGQRNLAVADAQAALGIRPGSEEARVALDRLGAPAAPIPPKRL